MIKSGHKDVASSVRLCKSIIEDADSILNKLTDEEQEIPTWWTNKLAICYAYMNSLRDYAYYSEDSISLDKEDDDDEEKENDIEVEKEDDDSSSGNITVGDYTTLHFDICPSAVELYSTITTKTDMVHLVVESMMLHDLLFKLEKFAISMGVADSEIIAKAQHYADMILALAEQMNLLDEHDYIEEVHMKKFMDLAIPTVDDDMLPPSVRMLKDATKAR
jgi:hypothetical protein